MNRKTVVSVLALCLLCAVLGATITYALTPSQVMTLSGGIYPGGPSYTIYELGGTYYGKDQNGYVVLSGSDFPVLVNGLLDLMPSSGGKLFFTAQNFTWTSTSYIDLTGHDNIVLEGEVKSLVTGSNLPTMYKSGSGYIIYKNEASFANHYVLITNLKLAGNGIDTRGMYFKNCKRFEILGNSISYINYSAIVLDACENIWIDNNDIQSSSTQGLIYSLSSGSMRITNNIISSGKYAIECLSYAGGVISGNTIADSSYDGIKVYSNKQISGGFEIVGNQIQDNGLHGINLDTATKVTITGNLIKDNGRLVAGSAGVNIKETSNNITVTANVIYDSDEADPTQDYAVAITNSADDITITGNIFGKHASNIIQRSTTGTNLIIKDNIGYKTEVYGSSTGTGAEQTIPHSLAGTPDYVFLSNKGADAQAYLSSASDATNIYVTADNGETYDYYAYFIP